VLPEPYYADGLLALHAGDALGVLREMPSGCVDCCVTSPPYFGQRDYGEDGQYGLEDSPAEYVERIRAVCAEVQRVLAKDGTFWLNLGDSYYSGRGNPGPNGHDDKQPARRGWVRPVDRPGMAWGHAKSLLLIPERLLIALYDDGWTIRNKGVWFKPNATPDPANDRLSAKWEPVYLLTKSRFYRFDLDAIREPYTRAEVGADRHPLGRNPGDVWVIPTQPFPGAHRATFPLELPLRCIKAGCKPGGTVLDPFSGSGTTGEAARRLGRRFVGIDLDAAAHDQALKERGLAQGVLDFTSVI
jgi:DNA modification methylase